MATRTRYPDSVVSVDIGADWSPVGAADLAEALGDFADDTRHVKCIMTPVGPGNSDRLECRYPSFGVPAGSTVTAYTASVRAQADVDSGGDYGELWSAYPAGLRLRFWNAGEGHGYGAAGNMRFLSVHRLKGSWDEYSADTGQNWPDYATVARLNSGSWTGSLGVRGNFDLNEGDLGVRARRFAGTVVYTPPAPGAVVLVGPEDGAAGVSRAPVLGCRALDEVGQPEGGVVAVEVALDAGFLTIVWSDSLAVAVANPTADHVFVAPLGALAPGTVYYWRCRQTNTTGSGTSAVRSFTTGASSGGGIRNRSRFRGR